MGLAEHEAHKAILARLKANSTLTGLCTGIFDLNGVPQSQTLPYIVVGETTQAPMKTFGKDGQNVTIAIHTWSSANGKKEIESIRSELYDTLDKRDLSMSGWQGSCLHDFGNVLEDDSTSVKKLHGVDRYRIKAREI